MRLKDLKASDMTDEQKRVAQDAIAGKRGHMPAPMRAWIYNPPLAERAQTLGEFVRYDTHLGAKLSELAILIVARFWTAHFEWYVHKKEALKAGLDPQIIESIRLNKQPIFADRCEKIIYVYATTLLNERQIPQALHDEAIAVLGVEGTVDLVGVIGYYGLVAMTLNAFAFELPDGEVYELNPTA